MKTIHTFAVKGCLFVFSLVLAIQAVAQTDADFYCASTNGCGTYITDVTIGTIVNNGTACSANGYSNFTNMSLSAVTGSTFQISVAAANTTASTVLKVFIDWNRDYDLVDAGESITISGSPGVGPYTASVTVPMNAFIGSTRIRVRIGTGNVVPCNSATTGETEDYTLNILPPVSITSIVPNVLCMENQVDIAYTTAITFNPGNVFTVQLSDDFGSFGMYTELGSMSATTSGVITVTIPNTLFFGTAYRIRLVSSNPVVTSLDNGTDITVSTPPNLVIVNPPAVCAPATVNITNSWTDINYVNGTVTYWTNEACTTAVANPSAINTGGTYYIRKVESDGGCVDIAPVVVTIYPKPLVNAGPDQYIIPGDSIQIPANVSSGTAPFTYLWTPSTGLSSAGILQPWAKPANTTTYTLSITDSHGCTGNDAVTVTVSAGGAGVIQGTVSYGNTAATPMSNTTVYLKNSSNVVLHQTTTNVQGQFTFNNVNQGAYHLMASSTKTWGGANAVDALLIMKHFVAMSLLSGLNLTAADVDGSGFVNAVDALTTMKRFVGMQSSFTVGDWAFQDFWVTVGPGQTITQNIKALCTGDVDNSFTPAP